MQAMQLGFNPEYSDSEPTLDAVQQVSDWAVLEFGANWCGHCMAAKEPIAQALTSRPVSLPHIKVADGPGQPLGRAFRVKLWPTLILLHDGEEVGRVVRPTGQQVVDALLQAVSD